MNCIISSVIPINDRITRIIIYDIFMLVLISFVLIKDTERDNYMTAEEALKYGLIDGIMDKRA